MLEFVIPKLHRSVVTRTGDAVIVTIPPKRRPAAFLIGVFYLGGALWLVAHLGSLLGSTVTSGTSSFGLGDAFLWLLLFIFLLFAVNGVYSLLFECWGVEVVRLHHGVLDVRRTVLGLGYCRSYAWERIQPLRLATEPYTRGWGIGRSLNGEIAFDHDGHQVRFGDDLEPEEALKVIELLTEHARQPAPLGAV